MTGGTVKSQRWWRYAVMRGNGIPAFLDGRWYDLDDMPPMPSDFGLHRFGPAGYMPAEATNRWEQRDDGAVAVVYEWVRPSQSGRT